MADDSFADRVSRTEARLESWCRDQNRFLAPDGSVYEDTAAMLLCRAPGTLMNWRSNGGMGVPFYRSGASGRVRYRLSDLAAYIEHQRQDAM